MITKLTEQMSCSLKERFALGMKSVSRGILKVREFCNPNSKGKRILQSMIIFVCAPNFCLQTDTCVFR